MDAPSPLHPTAALAQAEQQLRALHWDIIARTISADIIEIVTSPQDPDSRGGLFAYAQLLAAPPMRALGWQLYRTDDTITPPRTTWRYPRTP